jgi:hypothetical protein
VLDLLTVLATAEGAEETSKAPFYIAGGVLAAWAVLVSLAGMRGSFPRSDGAARAVMGVTALLVVGACVTAVITA